MSRCGCSSSACACLLEAGDGIEITGTGSRTNPYVVTNLGGGGGGGGGFTDAEIADLVSDPGSETGGAVLDVVNTRIAAHVALVDPHTQYHNNTRGDVRYYTKSQMDTLLAGKANVGEVGTGDVTGPGSSVNNRVVFFNGTSGKIIKDSGLTLSGDNTGDQTLAGLGGVSLTGNQTIAGTKTFSSSPVVPNGSWTIAKTTGLQSDLDDITSTVAAKADLTTAGGFLLMTQWPAGGVIRALCVAGVWQPRPILLRSDVTCLYISPDVADGAPADFVSGSDLLFQPTS